MAMWKVLFEDKVSCGLLDRVLDGIMRKAKRAMMERVSISRVRRERYFWCWLFAVLDQA